VSNGNRQLGPICLFHRLCFFFQCSSEFVAHKYMYVSYVSVCIANGLGYYSMCRLHHCSITDARTWSNALCVVCSMSVSELREKHGFHVVDIRNVSWIWQGRPEGRKLNWGAEFGGNKDECERREDRGSRAGRWSVQVRTKNRDVQRYQYWFSVRFHLLSEPRLQSYRHRPGHQCDLEFGHSFPLPNFNSIRICFVLMYVSTEQICRPN